MKKRKGLSLLELLVVLVIVSILATVVGVYVVSINRTNQLKALEVAQQTILTGLEKYKIVTGHYPQSQQEFESFLKDKQYFTAVPLNPFWSENDKLPEKGWLWDPVTQTVSPVK